MFNDTPARKSIGYWVSYIRKEVHGPSIFTYPAVDVRQDRIPSAGTMGNCANWLNMSATVDRTSSVCSPLLDSPFQT